MTAQLALHFRGADNCQASFDRAALVSALQHGQWLTAAQIAVMLDWTDRKVRDVASGSDEVVSFPGSPGYKLISACTRGEYERFRNALRSQARSMIARTLRADRKFFARTAA